MCYSISYPRQLIRVACNLGEQTMDQILQSTRAKIEQVLIQRDNIAMVSRQYAEYLKVGTEGTE